MDSNNTKEEECFSCKNLFPPSYLQTVDKVFIRTKFIDSQQSYKVLF